MAGDWIKMRVDLKDDPSVFKLAELLSVDELHVIGCLFCFWAWADKHAVDGHVDGATSRLVDKVSSTPGFCAAMQSVGWIVISEKGVSIPNFDRHNGESAKERGLKNARQARWRAGNKLDVDAQPSTATSTDASTREEKRREEKKEEQDPPATRVPRGTKKCPAGFLLNAELLSFAASEAPGVNVEREFDKFRDHTFKNANTDWAATFRNWMRNAADRAKPAGNSFMAAKAAENGKWTKGTSLDPNFIDTEFGHVTQFAIR